MPIINRMSALADDVAAWRRDIHQNPELLYDVHRTAGLVAAKLRAFGCDEVVTGVGRTGVVGLIHGSTRGSGRTIGLRADMDALPLTEITGLPHASTVPGKMHACGHDGHTAMLLGAAQYLAETRRFDGTVAVIFQPAEEGGAGADAMLQDGLMERFGIHEIYGMHNMPGMPVGSFGLRVGGLMAATDTFAITVTGRGGHAAKPHETIDPVVAACAIVGALQTVVSRGTHPVDALVISVTRFNAGTAENIIPETATLSGTIRTLSASVRAFARQRVQEIAEGVALAHGARAAVTLTSGYPAVENPADQTRFAGDVAARVVGESAVNRDLKPTLGGEDFAYLLQARPGAFIFMGNGDTAGLHHPAYDFNDAALPVGMSYWATLAETALPA